MKKFKLTPWFPPEIKPVHVGFYHIGKLDFDPRNDIFYEAHNNSYWDGKSWLAPISRIKSYYQNRYWRGILK